MAACNVPDLTETPQPTTYQVPSGDASGDGGFASQAAPPGNDAAMDEDVQPVGEDEIPVLRGFDDDASSE